MCSEAEHVPSFNMHTPPHLLHILQIKCSVTLLEQQDLQQISPKQG